MRGLTLAVLLIPMSASSAPTLRPERVLLRTDAGDLVLALYAGAPRHAEKLLALFGGGAYDGAPIATVHAARFAAVASRPGATTLRLPIESGGPHRAGVVAMAHQPGDQDLNETAFIILFTDIPAMDGRFSAVGEIIGGRDFLEALRMVPVDGTSRPIQPITVLSSVVRNSKTPLHPLPLSLGVIAFVAGIAIWLKGGPIWSSAGLLVSLAGYFSAFAALADLSSSSPWLSIPLFAATIGIFRLMSRFER